MALVELDDRHFIDKRFERLGELTGRGKYDARGRIEDLWFVCIRETRDVRTAEEIDNLIGWFEEKPFAELMVEARLAVPVEGGYRIRGVKERMDWLVELREKKKAAAPLGGAARAAGAQRDDQGRFLPVQPHSSHVAGDIQPQPATAKPPPSPPFPPPSPDPNAPAPKKRLPRASAAVTVTGPTWEAYRKAYAERHGEDPVRNARVNAMIKQFVDRVGAEEAPFVAAFYLTHNAQFYVQRMHPVGFMLQDAEKLRTEWATNRKMTAGEAKSAESRDFYSEQLKRLTGGGG